MTTAARTTYRYLRDLEQRAARPTFDELVEMVEKLTERVALVERYADYAAHMAEDAIDQMPHDAA